MVYRFPTEAISIVADTLYSLDLSGKVTKNAIVLNNNTICRNNKIIIKIQHFFRESSSIFKYGRYTVKPYQDSDP